jgi:hypothetical protein
MLDVWRNRKVLIYAYGRYWQNQHMVDNAVRCISEGRCVSCGQHLDGRISMALCDAWQKIAKLEAELLLEKSLNNANRNNL